jgi:2-keto-4-pentenoate hydratase/2-oxohepta-3-ene-1,7-dioic acid hydratase in catechol pathway
MELVSYWSGSELRAGAAENGKLVDAAHAGGYPASLRAIIAAGKVDAFVADARRALSGGTGIVELHTVRLGPPIPDPDKIICLGLNYSDHAAEAKMDLPKAPILFPKFRNSLIGPHDDIMVPRVATEALDYEVELGVVIGKRAREVDVADALDYVAGYSVINDVSARDLQMQTSQWAPGKAIDTFCPMGPGIVPAGEIGDPQNLMLTTRVNGAVLQHDSTKHMIFPVADTIAFITSFMTLEPGDIIATGTPAGVGFARKPPIRLHEGDVVEVEIEKIGALRNVIVFRSNVAPSESEIAAAQH